MQGKIGELLGKNDRIVYLDGATGTELSALGMPGGVCPESWVLENEDVFVGLQKRYIEAGSDILYTMTFSCNEIKLADHGLQDKQEEMVHKLVGLSRRAIDEARPDRKVLVFGDISMTGKQIKPVGELEFEELVDVYSKTVGYMVDAGVDGFAIETMVSLAEARAALIAVKENSDLPVLVTLTFENDGRSLFGSSPAAAVSVLQAMGADAVGMNCSFGPEEMKPLIRETLEYAEVPVVVKPNAGLPKLVEGKTVYSLDALNFGIQMKEIAELGVGIIGGCCGTTPDHIKELVNATKELPAGGFEKRKKKNGILSTERNVLEIDRDGAFMIIGERINPTGKNDLKEALKNENLEFVADMAVSQVEAGAKILDVNLGMSGIDEKDLMCKVVDELTLNVDVPLSIDSSDPDVIEAALRRYPGRALINSISLEPGKSEKLLPIAKKYGAMVILLPIGESGLPKDMTEKHKNADELIELSKKVGLREEDLVVDGLVATVGANKNAAIEVLETIRYIREEKNCYTVCGLSNISFGLPERAFVNTAFLTMAISRGLNMAISNPSQTLLTNAALASDLLLNKPGADENYINGVRAIQSQAVTVTKTSDITSDMGDISELTEAVIKGRSARIVGLVDDELQHGNAPGSIIDEQLIPAINKVGELFEKKIFFLPQLIASAESMAAAMNHLEPMIANDASRQKLESVVMATVKGDVHDIGKNLVVMMLKNYGYNVTDLGKDVETELIIRTAKEKNARIIGLSALMTTTMTEMAEVVKARNAAGLDAKIIVGGACVTEEYAGEIGADGYSDDAAEAVRVVNRLLGR
ncbi:MAG: homocysteine S-methyltransferase family protein [Eubacterium sp.]|nr:homocysteine S-methyltransferase family protein [Eubacterium sp.]